jgi:putative serine protease PepD
MMNLLEPPQTTTQLEPRYPIEADPQSFPQPQRRTRILWPISLMVVALAVAATAFFVTRGDDTTAQDAVPATALATEDTAPSATSSPRTTASEATPATTSPPAESAPALGTLLAVDASGVADKVIPSIVTVQVSGPAGAGASGSGVIYDTEGRIITNDHVVEVGNRFRVVLADARIYEADLLGTDPATDLAVLQIDAEALTPIEIGSADALSVGDPAIAVGSPLGLEGGPSLSVGVISAEGREVSTSATTTLFGMLQTDAPITSGSSGGALVDGDGKLVGITTAVGVSSVGVEGIGFATPIEIVQRVIDEIVDTGSASSPFLGISGQTAYAATDDGGDRPIGVDVASVEPGSAADDAGMEPGDVVTAVNGVPIDTMDELISQLRRYSSGEEITLSTSDNGVLTVSLGSR